MAASFTYQTGYTVASSYIWDNGTPFSSNTTLLSTPTLSAGGVVTGYSPGTIVYFNNTTTPTSSIASSPGIPGLTSLSSLYFWNFGDYYNVSNNTVVLSCASPVSHTYIMPGVYSVTLTVIETLSSASIGIYNNLPNSSLGNCVVKLQEDIPPTALMHSMTQPVYGESPYQVTITARGSTPGSFPIDRIDWDLDDGSPLLTISRYTVGSTGLTCTSAISGDLLDPRNYDINHTYKLSTITSQTFYPSITAYSSSTNKFSTCSLTIGPIYPPNATNNTHLLKARNTPQGKIYGLQIDNNIALLTTLSSTGTNNSIINTPTNIIKDSFNTLLNSSINGNPGTDYFSITAIC